ETAARERLRSPRLRSGTPTGGLLPSSADGYLFLVAECPSCTTRRMQGTATHLLDRVLPHVPMRQWVLSLPRWARFLLARDPQLITRALDIALRPTFSLQPPRARRAGARAPRTGAATSVQPFR